MDQGLAVIHFILQVLGVGRVKAGLRVRYQPDLNLEFMETSGLG